MGGLVGMEMRDVRLGEARGKRGRKLTVGLRSGH